MMKQAADIKDITQIKTTKITEAKVAFLIKDITTLEGRIKSIESDLKELKDKKSGKEADLLKALKIADELGKYITTSKDKLISISTWMVSKNIKYKDVMQEVYEKVDATIQKLIDKTVADAEKKVGEYKRVKIDIIDSKEKQAGVWNKAKEIFTSLISIFSTGVEEAKSLDEEIDNLINYSGMNGEDMKSAKIESLGNSQAEKVFKKLIAEKKHAAQKSFDVYLNGKKIDTVFQSHPSGFKTKEEREEDVKRGLVNHDGYAPRIIVKESTTKHATAESSMVHADGSIAEVDGKGNVVLKKSNGEVVSGGAYASLDAAQQAMSSQGYRVSNKKVAGKTRKDYEKYLNDMDDGSFTEEKFKGNKNQPLGTWMRNNDPTQFNVGYNEWVQNRGAHIKSNLSDLKLAKIYTMIQKHGAHNMIVAAEWLSKKADEDETVIGDDVEVSEDAYVGENSDEEIVVSYTKNDVEPPATNDAEIDFCAECGEPLEERDLAILYSMMEDYGYSAVADGLEEILLEEEAHFEEMTASNKHAKNFIGQLTIYNSRGDMYGNRYWAFTYEDYDSGKIVEGKCDANVDGVDYGWTTPKEWERGIHKVRKELPIRQFNTMVKGWPYAGSGAQDNQKFIKDAIGQANQSVQASKKKADYNDENFEIIDHGIANSSYFQGCGTAFTQYNRCSTGVGDDAEGAYNDAIEMMYQDDIDSVEIDALDLPEFSEIADSFGTDSIDYENEEAIGDDNNELYYFVSIRWKDSKLPETRGASKKKADFPFSTLHPDRVRINKLYSDIERAKRKLVGTKMVENFGQKEVSKIKDKYFYCRDIKPFSTIILEFDEWCMNYIGNYSDEVKQASVKKK